MLKIALDIGSDEIGAKLKAGEPLDDSETQLMIDVWVLRFRLAM